MRPKTQLSEQAKCNFCCNWFHTFSQIKFGLNLCEQCIYKATNTNCFKVPTPNGVHQLYLAKKYIRHGKKEDLLEKVDEYMHWQIRNMIQKWEELTKIIQAAAFLKGEDQVWLRLQKGLQKDARNFQQFSCETVDTIRNQVNQFLKAKETKNDKKSQTPLKSRNGLSRITKSRSKQIQRSDSKMSLKSFNNQKNNQQKQNAQQFRKNQTSPLKRTNSSKGLPYWQIKQNKEYANKIETIKNNITVCLEDRLDESVLREPVNIMKQRVYTAIQHTKYQNKTIQLVSYTDFYGIDIKSYLKNLQWEGVQVVKFVKVGLTDEQLMEILEFIKNKNIETLVITGNNLTEESCRILLETEMKNLKNIYFGKNQIFPIKVKNELKQLKIKYNFYM